jgi:Group II intron, maturase-specific domain
VVAVGQQNRCCDDRLNPPSATRTAATCLSARARPICFSTHGEALSGSIQGHGSVPFASRVSDRRWCVPPDAGRPGIHAQAQKADGAGAGEEVFGRRSPPIERVIDLINPVLRGWVNYFAVGHSSECFSFIKDCSIAPAHFERSRVCLLQCKGPFAAMRFASKSGLKSGSTKANSKHSLSGRTEML